jgi:ubiquinol-cytochrome c reductase iron-sulfur subunit
MKLPRWLVALVALAVGRKPPPPARERGERIVPAGEPDPGAELAVVVLLLCGAACSVAFIVFYAWDGAPSQTQLLGGSLGLALAFFAAALIVVAKRLVVDEELEEDYPDAEHPEEQAAVADIVEQSGSRFTRKRLLTGTAALAGGALGAAVVTPALSLGPLLDLDRLAESPWRKGRRLVDRDGAPYRASEIETATFYTAYPEGGDRDLLGAPLVVVRLAPADLRLPAGRGDWAPEGILAYSKVCTHAGCAVALYRKPLFPPLEPKPALVCPCHYSTFDPAAGAKVIFGPAGRPLPQLPLEIDSAGHLRAAGNYSGPVGPSWSGVRNHRAGPIR